MWWILGSALTAAAFIGICAFAGFVTALSDENQRQRNETFELNEKLRKFKEEATRNIRAMDEDKEEYASLIDDLKNEQAAIVRWVKDCPFKLSGSKIELIPEPCDQKIAGTSNAHAAAAAVEMAKLMRRQRS